jgi:transcriptional regulator with XRE-family HTH domain
MLKEFARDLKTIREQKDISLKSIAQQTRLNLSALESLEAGDFTFQPQTYIRAFLKQYIAALDLDVEEVLFDYDLARSGKYKPKFVHEPERTAEVISAPQNKDNSEKEHAENIKTTIADFDSRSKEKQIEDSTSDVYNDLPETSSKVRIIRDLPPKKTPVVAEAQKDAPSFNFLASSLFRKIIFTVLGVLILLGIYSLINILFIEGKNESPEIIRQNFDEVVKEQEKRLLGKKTPEEIQDSIKKANELSKSKNDSIMFMLTGLEYGEIYVVTDSSNYSDPKKITYDKGDVKTFKAKSSLHITSGNTKTFEAILNGSLLEFDTKAVRKVKITKEGVVK